MRFWYNHARRDRTPNFGSLLWSSISEAYSTGQIKPYDSNKRPLIYHSQAITSCELKDDQGQTLACGYSFCRDDQFNRKDGRDRARNRALDLARRRGLLPDEQKPQVPGQDSR